MKLTSPFMYPISSHINKVYSLADLCFHPVGNKKQNKTYFILSSSQYFPRTCLSPPSSLINRHSVKHMPFVSLLILAGRGMLKHAGWREDAFSCDLAMQTLQSVHFSSMELTHTGV